MKTSIHPAQHIKPTHLHTPPAGPAGGTGTPRHSSLKRGLITAAFLLAGAASAQAGFVNPGFELPRFSPGVPNFIIVQDSTVPGWKTTAGDRYIEFWTDGVFGVPPFEGAQFVELNAYQQGALYQDALGIPAGVAVGFKFAHRGRTGVETIRVRIIDLGPGGVLGGMDDTVLFSKNYADGTSAWGSYSSLTEPLILSLGNTVRFQFESLNTGSLGNFLDACDFGTDVVNTAPTVTAPPVATIHCTALNDARHTVTFNVSDANNDPMTVIWSVDGVVVETHSLPAGSTSDSLVDYLFPVIAPLTHTVSGSVTDNKSAPVLRSATVIVAAHDAPAPSLASLPDITGECDATITVAPTAVDDCDIDGGALITGTTTDPLTYTAQGTYTVTWTYTDPHDPAVFTTQTQTVIVKDTTPPEITCPPDVTVAYGAVPAAATTPAEFIAQGGTITDHCDPNGTVASDDVSEGICPIIVTRTYRVTDAAGNPAYCEQIITVENLFAADGILWHQPLARNGASEDTDPSADGTLKYRFKLGSTIPIKIHAQGCEGAVTGNANVSGKVVVFGDTDMDGVADSGELAIDFNGVGEAGGVMDRIDGHLRYNLDTKKLPPTFKCYILQVTVTDDSTGESRAEIIPLQSR